MVKEAHASVRSTSSQASPMMNMASPTVIFASPAEIALKVRTKSRLFPGRIPFSESLEVVRKAAT